MKSVFTILWCIKLNFDPTCVYMASFILDAVICIFFMPYGFGRGDKNSYQYWPYWIFLILSIIVFLMAIFAIIQIVTKNSSASSRHATYVQCRMYTILGLAIGGLILFVLGLVNNQDSRATFGTKLNWSFSWGAPLFLAAAALHCYHENFI